MHAAATQSVCCFEDLAIRAPDFNSSLVRMSPFLTLKALEFWALFHQMSWAHAYRSSPGGFASP